METLYVVEANFQDGTWGICSFANKEYCSTNYFTAHRLKRDLQKYLKEYGNKKWYKKRFRVIKYRAVL